MRRAISVAAGLGLAGLAAAPARAAGGSKLPQMDFANPLTVIQIVWMAVILVALYVALARWGLPRVGQVIETRRARIQSDLDAARLARSQSEGAIRALDRAIRQAREESDRTVARAIDEARARARADGEAARARLAADLARAETQIANARATAMRALVPIAEDVATSLIARISGEAPARARLDTVLAAAVA